MTVKIYDIPVSDVEYAEAYVCAVMMNLQDQGAPVGDDLELEDGWFMTWELYPHSEFTRYRIFDEDE